MFHLTITADLDRFVADPEHEARAEGYVVCDALGGKLPVERGVFNLFVDDGDPARRRMLYTLFVRDGRGEALTLAGVKLIEDDPGFDLWRDTTTLFTRILRGHLEDDGEAEVIAEGTLRIRVGDFARQLTTFRAEGPSRRARAAALARFGALFMGGLWDVYGRRYLSPSPF